MRRTLVLVVLAVALVATALGVAASRGAFGERQTGGEVTAVARDPVPAPARASYAEAPTQILFGDLHVHTTFSFDAFNISLPMYQGEGSHPPADACDFARFCSRLDFWSINDHAEGLTPREWRETKRAVRACDDVAGESGDPDLVTFLGWEWTQIGRTPADHYGHKNVILRDLEEGAVPARPIASRDSLFPGDFDPFGGAMRLLLIATAGGDRGRQPYHDFARFLEDRKHVPTCADDEDPRSDAACKVSAPTPTELFTRLDAWGFPYLVIPHGNTWGFYTPPRSSWDAQLAAHRDPERHEPLIEVFSGHGNIEQYRDWSALEVDDAGALVCPAPSAGYVPECWRAGEIIRARCLGAGESEATCEARAEETRRRHVAAEDAGHLVVPGAEVADWLDAGQCTDCYMPAYNHRPGGSVQYGLAIRNFGDPGAPKRFRWGLIGSSDVHTARPGTGYKELMRRRMTDAGLGNLGPPPVINAADPEPFPRAVEDIPAPTPYFERFASFFGAGGLVAVHSTGRDRTAIWEALGRKQVYGTSGDRILLWFDLLDEAGEARPMGSSVASRATPRFTVRALGAFEQKPGCPPDAARALGAERLEHLCRGECYHPSDRRRRIDRIEVVRIRPQQHAGEPVVDLIEDPWRILPCDGAGPGCSATFDDPEYADAARDTVYYVRAIQEATPTLNGDQLRCTRDASGACVEVDPCFASDPTAYEDDCLAPAEERAWSSPIFVDHPGPQDSPG